MSLASIKPVSPIWRVTMSCPAQILPSWTDERFSSVSSPMDDPVCTKTTSSPQEYSRAWKSSKRGARSPMLAPETNHISHPVSCIGDGKVGEDLTVLGNESIGFRQVGLHWVHLPERRGDRGLRLCYGLNLYVEILKFDMRISYWGL